MIACTECGYTPKPGEKAIQTFTNGKLVYTCPSCRAKKTDRAFIFSMR